MMSKQSLRTILYICCFGIFISWLVIDQKIDLAQAQNIQYELTLVGWGSGGQTSGGEYTMDAIVGQPEADQISGGAYTFSGGVANSRRIVVSNQEPVDNSTTTFLPLIRR